MLNVAEARYFSGQDSVALLVKVGFSEKLGYVHSLDSQAGS